MRDFRSSAFIVLSLGLGMGANCALFAVVNSLLLRPLPYAEPERLVEVTPRGVDVRDVGAFEGVASFEARGFSVRGDDGPRFVYGNRVTPELLSVLGVKPLLGRVFQPGDQVEPVAILCYDFWRRVSGEPNIIGQTMTIDGEARAIVGVLGPDFHLQVRDINIMLPARQFNDGRTIARLKAGVPLAEAQRQVEAVAGSASEPVRLRLLRDAFRPREGGTVLLFQAAVAFVLLITCANVANLLLVRASARRREFAIRAAIGAGRIRLLAQLLKESLTMALAGAGAGLLLAWWLLPVLSSQLPANIGRFLRGADALSIDLNVVGFMLSASVLTVLIFGVAPAFSALRFNLASALKDGAKGASPERQRYGGLLVVAEIALALMLLVAAGLTLKSLSGLEKRDLGFSADHVLRVTLDRIPNISEVIARVESMPGVESVGIVGPQLFPFGGPQAGRSRPEVYYASPAYFRTVRIPLLRGRFFAANEPAPVMLISQVVARRTFGEADPLGRSIGGMTVIGIVGDVRNPVGVDVQPTVYRPLAQADPRGGTMMVRTAGPPLDLAPAIRRELRAMLPDAPEFRTADLGTEVVKYLGPQRFSTSIFGIFAGLGLFLAAGGVYGVMRNWVAMRVPEIGMRVALGAQRGDVLRLVLVRCSRVAGLGIAVGLAGALALQRLLMSQLHGVSPSDPGVLAMVVGVMALVAFGAALLPALWASRVDPLEALRHE